ncbi:Eco57I restriction-modification methylase domain-containing protein [Candidatus Saccharibacteria bacterium]|nr:Eco57I restriction-modification methylase domain-containing protein [Candidatus Saccharibacteria bacterium]
MSEQTKNLLGGNYNPDVLECLANLSNDEVFTPPKVVNQMLDMLPPETWSNPNLKFLDPACKTGVFLREIAKRLIVGLEEEIPNLNRRLYHIFHNQLYGIAITELTALTSRRSVYCSRDANSDYSVMNGKDYIDVKENTTSGNIRFVPTKHTWNDGKCIYCGASESQYKRSDDLETHAYEFIHTNNPEEIFGMKFDVIIGNPPYQISTGGGQAQAMPIYQKFVTNAKQMKPTYLSMIIPSRYFSGGIGLNEFRNEMLHDRHISHMTDYIQSNDVFPGVVIAGGINYFLWDVNYSGNCKYTVIDQGEPDYSERSLDEYDIFVRSNKGIDIIKKILNKKEQSISEIMSSLSPFGLNSNVRGHKDKGLNRYKLVSSDGVGYIDREEVLKGKKYLNAYKVAISYATSGSAASADKDGLRKVLAKLILLKPEEVCTFTYFLAGPFNSLDESENCKKYLSTKFVRYLLFLSLSSIHVSRDKFRFVPIQDFSKAWTDSELYDKYKLSRDEIDLIESMIKPMEDK